MCALCPQLTHWDYNPLLSSFPITKKDGCVKIACGVCSTGENISVLSRLTYETCLSHGVWGPSGREQDSLFLQTLLDIDLTVSTLAHCLRIIMMWLLCILLEFIWEREVKLKVGYFETGSSFWSNFIIPLYSISPEGSGWAWMSVQSVLKTLQGPGWSHCSIPCCPT